MSRPVPPTGGTFQPLRHRSGTLRDRLHGYTKQTLGAGGSLNDAVSRIGAKRSGAKRSDVTMTIGATATIVLSEVKMVHRATI